jgi:hypothetical protein
VDGHFKRLDYFPENGQVITLQPPVSGDKWLDNFSILDRISWIFRINHPVDPVNLFSKNQWS